jgi:hypothetical protein
VEVCRGADVQDESEDVEPQTTGEETDFVHRFAPHITGLATISGLFLHYFAPVVWIWFFAGVAVDIFRYKFRYSDIDRRRIARAFLVTFGISTTGFLLSPNVSPFPFWFCALTSAISAMVYFCVLYSDERLDTNPSLVAFARNAGRQEIKKSAIVRYVGDMLYWTVYMFGIFYVILGNINYMSSFDTPIVHGDDKAGEAVLFRLVILLQICVVAYFFRMITRMIRYLGIYMRVHRIT